MLKQKYFIFIHYQTHISKSDFFFVLIIVCLEHEAHMRDILELRWHIEDKSYEIKQLEKKRAGWEEANEKIQADIDYMNEHSTLLNSKLLQEMEDLKEYGKKKIEVSK